jgi:hypothetical protein
MVAIFLIIKDILGFFLKSFCNVAKHGLRMKQDIDKKHLILDFVVVGIFLLFFMAFNFWKGIGVIFGIYLFFYLIGFLKSKMSNNVEVIEEQEEILEKSEDVKTNLSNVVKPKEATKKVMGDSRITSIRTPDGRQVLEISDDKIHEWLAKNPDLKVEERT